MDKYDPSHAPDPGAWNALDEAERLHLVQQYHKRERIKLPKAEVHAAFHVVVENQIAMGAEMNVSKTLERLLAGGLDRHDALHAILAVLVGQMQSVLNGNSSKFSNDAYESALDDLSVEKWRMMGQSDN